MKLLKRWFATLLLSGTVFSQLPTPPTGPEPAVSVVRRIKVTSEYAKALVIQTAPVKYPDAARTAGVQGEVVLGVVVGLSGEVQEVKVLSGDPTLAQAAIEAMKQWKYKPYTVDGSPTEMETEVTVNFRLRGKPEQKKREAPPLGRFSGDTYSNEYFGLSYPLSRDWVRETQLLRKRVGADASSQNTYVLVAAVYVPQDAELRDVDSSLSLIAVDFPGSDCKRYFDAFAASLHSHKEGQQKGEVSQFAAGKHDFYRADYEYRDGTKNRSVVCSLAKDYLLLWNLSGASRNAVETAATTVKSVSFPPSVPADSSKPAAATPVTTATPETLKAKPSPPEKVRVSQGVSAGLLVKKVPPIYPSEARHAHIEGTVVLQANIAKTGDITDLEVLDGPIELAVSAVNAVRQWKYRPYLLLGEPVAVETQIVVNYRLSH
jgi:protein TonB